MTKIVIFGATGYVGSRLTGQLLDQGYTVRVTFRNKNKLKRRPWFNHSNLDMVYCDIFEYNTVLDACKNYDIAYYLIHSMDPNTSDFESADKIAAQHFRKAAEETSISHLIYLGGIGDKEDQLSAHLRSRIEVADILRESSVDHTILKAAIIIGGGSASFEIMRYLVERLPVMITPSWVRTKSQPIAIRNVLYYLVNIIGNEATHNQTFDIGGPDVISYQELMTTYAELAGLTKRLILPVPVLSPRLSSYWVNRVTPINHQLATPLIEGLRNPAITTEDRIKEVIPQNLLSIREAISLALNERKNKVEYSALGKIGIQTPIEWSQPGDDEWSGGPFYYDRRVLLVKGDPREIWQTIKQIGGKNGYYYANFLWSIRGAMDRIIGGPGLTRGRKNQDKITKGDYLDFWRVTHIVEGQSLILRAEMKLPGIATLKFSIHQKTEQKYLIEQVASFVPKGLLGLLYWKAIEPLHQLVFRGMLVGIAKFSKSTILNGPLLLKHL